MRTSMHAHICEKCKESGKQTIWVHEEKLKGDVAAHTCPECGTIQWKQFLVEPSNLPRQHNHAQTPSQSIGLPQILSYVVLFIGLAFLGYASYLYLKNRKEKTAQ